MEFFKMSYKGQYEAKESKGEIIVDYRGEKITWKPYLGEWDWDGYSRDANIKKVYKEIDKTLDQVNFTREQVYLATETYHGELLDFTEATLTSRQGYGTYYYKAVDGKKGKTTSLQKLYKFTESNKELLIAIAEKTIKIKNLEKYNERDRDNLERFEDKKQ